MQPRRCGLLIASALLVAACEPDRRSATALDAAAAHTPVEPSDLDAGRDAIVDAAYVGASANPPLDAMPIEASALSVDAGPRDDAAHRDAETVPDASDLGAPTDAGTDAANSDVDAFILGADITWVQADEARGVRYRDEGAQRDILAILRSHGFNYIRLRLFVDPRAADGYDRRDGFADLTHTLAFGRRIKAAGMGFLLDLHYSDNWADPGKQCVPVAWQKHPTIAQLAAEMGAYTEDVIRQLSAGGARPDMVQLGNEITSGMLLHVCDADGLPLRVHQVRGDVANWSQLGPLLRAAANAVREVDPSIGIMLHIDRCGDKGAYAGYALETSTQFITQAKAQGIAFEYFGESCYQQYQGDPNSTSNTKLNWQKTLSELARRFPTLRFIAAEYGPMQREVNDVVFGLPDGRGAGSFVWEPTREGDWNRGHVLFAANGLEATATRDLALYDAMRRDYTRSAADGGR